LKNKITIARNLRKRLTDAERLLWSKIRAKQIADTKFRRQAPIGKYIVDFICHEKKLIIELDGGSMQIVKKTKVGIDGLRMRDIKF
jgi:very-short-patch-repair endonuclease